MPEKLPDLGLGIKGIAANGGEKHQRSGREHQRASESVGEDTCCLRACEAVLSTVTVLSPV